MVPSSSHCDEKAQVLMCVSLIRQSHPSRLNLNVGLKLFCLTTIYPSPVLNWFILEMVVEHNYLTIKVHC